MTEPLLKAEKLSKRFGAVVANDGLDLTVTQNSIHALIGPNGAGKTTAISLLSGEQRLDGGRIRFQGRDLSRMPGWKRARAGLHRSYQITSLFNDDTALDNVHIALLARQPHVFRFLSRARADRNMRDEAMRWLEVVNLGSLAAQPVHTLAHGKRRQLELAVVLAMQPTMLLLDEPMAGMGRAESDELVEIIHGIRREHTMLLVEHDMDVVFGLADRITVMVKGKDIACGSPDVIRADSAVRDAYLGNYGEEA